MNCDLLKAIGTRSMVTSSGIASIALAVKSFSSEKGATMKTKLATGTMLIGALLLPVAAYSADYDTDRSSPKAFVKDSVITAKVKAQMVKDRDVSALHIRVDTDNKGVVTLSGKAKSPEEAAKAVAIARSVEGVVSVENNIQVVADR